MQYIQLQGQVAETLDLPIEGGFNLFIDTSDNSIKAKDFEGTITGGGLSLIEATREEAGQLVLSASLTPGAFYKITGVASASFYEANSISYTGYGNEIQDGGTTIILQAASDSTLSKKGIGLFYVPNYENPEVPTVPPDTNYLVWDSTSRLEFSSSFGVFDHDEFVHLYANGTSSYSNLRANIGNSSITLETPGNEEGPYYPDFFTNPDNYPMSIVGDATDAWAGVSTFYTTASYNAGDCVIWGGRVWENLSGSVGYETGGWPLAQLTLNDEDWTVVPFNETNYTIVADLIEYEFEWDNISYRKGANNVEVRNDGRLMLDEWGYNMIKYFPWGHYGTQNISISNSYLDAFVNYPHDAWAEEIKFADYGEFNAQYWGRQTSISNITGDFGAEMVSLNLGYNTRIRRITLGIDARISDIYTYDNDNYTYTLYEITLGTDATIDDNSDAIYMYFSSYMENLILENNATISDINLYKGSRIKDSKLGIDSRISTIALNDYADFRQVEVGNDSVISDMNLDVSSCFKRVKIGTDAYIEYVSIGVDGNFKHVEMADESNMSCIAVGHESYFQYINLGISSQIATVAQIKYDNSPSTASYFENINVGINCNISSIAMDTNSSLNNFEVASEGGFVDLIVSESVGLSRFKIGQDFHLNGVTFTSSMSDIRIDYGFNNFGANDSYDGYYNNGEESVNAGNFTSTATSLEGAAGIQSVYAIELVAIADFSSQAAEYYLPNGTYNGQTVELVLVGDIGNLWDSNAYGVRVWMESLRLTGGTLYDKAGSIFTNTWWYPFSKDASDNSVLRESNPRAIWIQGAWTIDNGCWQD